MAGCPPGSPPSRDDEQSGLSPPAVPPYRPEPPFWPPAHWLLAPEPPPAPPPPRWGRALGLFLLTFLSTTTLGAVWVASAAGATDLPLVTLPSVISAVWGDSELLTLGLQFSLPALFILLCHEMGHYVACRHYGLPATLPFFLPTPIGIGTLGAFIRIRAPIRRKQELFDVGVAGPLAGMVALLPFLVLGILWSKSVPLAEIPPELPILVPGESLLFGSLRWAFHGELAPDRFLLLHPFALAAWFGLLATALNLLPLGQLDGGHVLYAALGQRQRRLAVPLWLTLAAIGWYWPGWLLWCVLTLSLGLFHPPVVDEVVPLSSGRRVVALLTLVLFVLAFTPVPITELVARP